MSQSQKMMASQCPQTHCSHLQTAGIDLNGIPQHILDDLSAKGLDWSQLAQALWNLLNSPGGRVLVNILLTSLGLPTI